MNYTAQSCDRADSPVRVRVVGVVVVGNVVVVVSSGNVDPENRSLVPALTRHPGLGTSPVYRIWEPAAVAAAAARDLLSSRLWCLFRLESRGSVCDGLTHDWFVLASGPDEARAELIAIISECILKTGLGLV